jgi:hypothetical protein
LHSEKSEFWCVLLFLPIFWLFNVLTATSYPFAHQDEAMFATPAIHYLRGEGFHIPFSEMVSLYCFLLVPWIKIFGHSLRSVRTLEITCVTAAFFILWSAVRRFRLVEKPVARVMMLLLLSTEFGVIVSYRTGRYDGMGFLILASTLWAMSMSAEQKSSVNVLLVRQEWLINSGVWRQLEKRPGRSLFQRGHILLDGKKNLKFLSIPDDHLLVYRRQ